MLCCVCCWNFWYFRKISYFARKEDEKIINNIMNIHNDKQNKRYRRKYKFLKLRIKSLILENAALCDEVAKIQESINIVKDERKFLLHKLIEYENDNDSNQSYRNRSEPIVITNGGKGKVKKRHSLDDSR